MVSCMSPNILLELGRFGKRVTDEAGYMARGLSKWRYNSAVRNKGKYRIENNSRDIAAAD